MKNKAITIGILGAGQLAKMLAIEAYRLGYNIAVIDNAADTPAGDMTKLDFTKGWNDKDELNKFIAACDIITLENEFISPDVLEYISEDKEVFPTANTMKLIQDKYIQKSVFREKQISVPIFDKMDSINDLLQFGKKFSYPFIVKARTLGYDGYGNMTINNENDCTIAWNKFNSNQTKRELMAEEFIDFKCEVAVMVARSKNGETKTYPCVETIQQNHICHRVIVPARMNIDLAIQAQELAQKTVLAIDGIGIFGVEMFVTKDSKILVNEIAPRPHNSGHYTIEACQTSQYENAIRAILGLPLGSTKMLYKAAVMTNLLGTRSGSGAPTSINNMFQYSNTKLHIYNKKQSRIGRKMGHITTCGDNIENVLKEADSAFDAIKY